MRYHNPTYGKPSLLKRYIIITLLLFCLWIIWQAIGYALNGDASGATESQGVWNAANDFIVSTKDKVVTFYKGLDRDTKTGVWFVAIFITLIIGFVDMVIDDFFC